MAAFGSVVAFYAHALIGRPAAEVTPVVTVGVAFSFAALGLLGLLTMRIVRPGTAARQLSAAFLFLAVFLASISTFAALIHRAMSTADWGVFVMQIALPVLLTLCPTRIDLLRAVCRIALVFAVADFTLNALSYMGVVNLVEHVGGASSYGLHYLGLPGSSFAEGLVAFLAIVYVAFGTLFSRSALALAARFGLIALLFLSEWLIRARVDFGLSIVAVVLLLLGRSLRLPLVSIALLLTMVFLVSTFYPNIYETDEVLRQYLMEMGARTALHHPLLGAGVHYRATADLVAGYRQLHEAGITESGTLDFAIAYGIPATVCLYLSAFFALAATRVRQTLPAVLFGLPYRSSSYDRGIGVFSRLDYVLPRPGLMPARRVVAPAKWFPTDMINADSFSVII